jgi:hypothetical protein
MDVKSGQQKPTFSKILFHLPERVPNSIVRIASLRLVHPEHVKDFEMQVIEDDPTK